jgi:superfamily II DNA/RNA helicase
VACVIHYDLPPDPKDYVHRSGRTGRAGASGTVVAFVPPAQQKDARAIQRAVGLPDGLTAPDFAAHEIPTRVAKPRSAAPDVTTDGPSRRNGAGGAHGRPGGSRGSRSGHGHGSKPAGKKNSWRKRSNAAKAKARSGGGAGHSGRR